MELIHDGEKAISEKIRAAVAANQSIVEITGNYEIASPVILPSHITLILRDCYLRMKDGAVSQMFVNEHWNDPAVTDTDIHLVGVGRAVLDGGEYNGLSEKNALTEGRPEIYFNNILLFAGVRDFSVTGIAVRNQRWWALNFIGCSQGLLRDIDFDADATRIDPVTGERVRGLKRGDYASTYVKNADGIDLRAGCHDILIENVTGFTEDDTVALTALWNNMEKHFLGEDFPEDRRSIYNVTIRNIRSSAYCTIVRLLNQGGTKLYNILVDGVFDTSAEDDRLDTGLYAVRLGDRRSYGGRAATPEETRAIVIRNVFGRGQAVVQLSGSAGELSVENIHAFGDGTVPVDDRRTEVTE